MYYGRNMLHCRIMGYIGEYLRYNIAIFIEKEKIQD